MGAAILIANGISNPLLNLNALTERIRLGEHVKQFPKQSTAEITVLFDAISTMQNSIVKRERVLSYRKQALILFRKS